MFIGTNLCSFALERYNWFLNQIQMTDKEKIQTLEKCFTETIWMAIRYAHGRQTFAPRMVRDAVNDFKKVFPDWEPKSDIVIKPPEDDEVGGFKIREDWLDDLFSKNKQQ